MLTQALRGNVFYRTFALSLDTVGRVDTGICTRVHVLRTYELQPNAVVSGGIIDEQHALTTVCVDTCVILVTNS